MMSVLWHLRHWKASVIILRIGMKKRNGNKPSIYRCNYQQPIVDTTILSNFQSDRTKNYYHQKTWTLGASYHRIWIAGTPRFLAQSKALQATNHQLFETFVVYLDFSN
jgi:hypothetical protein